MIFNEGAIILKCIKPISTKCMIKLTRAIHKITRSLFSLVFSESSFWYRFSNNFDTFMVLFLVPNVWLGCCLSVSYYQVFVVTLVPWYCNIINLQILAHHYYLVNKSLNWNPSTNLSLLSFLYSTNAQSTNSFKKWVSSFLFAVIFFYS